MEWDGMGGNGREWEETARVSFFPIGDLPETAIHAVSGPRGPTGSHFSFIISKIVFYSIGK